MRNFTAAPHDINKPAAVALAHPAGTPGTQIPMDTTLLAAVQQCFYDASCRTRGHIDTPHGFGGTHSCDKRFTEHYIAASYPSGR
jgi:hypothetical protein